MKRDYVFTNNKGKLEIIGEFETISGLDSWDIKMGQAKDKEGNIYDIYPASCDLGRCFCWATALQVGEKPVLKAR